MRVGANCSSSARRWRITGARETIVDLVVDQERDRGGITRAKNKGAKKTMEEKMVF
jgi:hypothetical protein